MLLAQDEKLSMNGTAGSFLNFDYLQRNVMGRTSRVVVVGAKETGKTSILERAIFANSTIDKVREIQYKHPLSFRKKYSCFLEYIVIPS